MRKYVAILLAAMLVLGVCSFAFAADLKLGGDARVRGIYSNNDDFDSDADDTHRYWDQRIRLKLHADIGEGVEVRTRLGLSGGSNAKWDGGSNTGAAVATDYAYIVVPAGPAQVLAGRQNIDWGNKFWVWDARADRFTVSYKVGEMGVGAYTTKGNEVSDVGTTDGGGDTDSYGVYVNYAKDTLKAGAIAEYTNDDTPVTGDSGTVIDAYLNGTFGPVGVAGELAFKSGELYEDSAGNSPMGGFVAGSMNIEPATVSLALAYAKNTYIADDNFTPTLLFGGSQITAFTLDETAIGADVNGDGDASDTAAGIGFGAGDDDGAYAIVAGASFKPQDTLTVGAKLAYARLSTETDDTSLIEVDATVDYKLAKNTMLSLGLAYGMPGDALGDDAVVKVAHKIEISLD